VKKRRLGPQNGPKSMGLIKLLKIVSCQKTFLSQLEKVGGHRDPPGSYILKECQPSTNEEKGIKEAVDYIMYNISSVQAFPNFEQEI
jgi:hypothetical protein